jgi:hypothetical protein
VPGWHGEADCFIGMSGTLAGIVFAPGEALIVCI